MNRNHRRPFSIIDFATAYDDQSHTDDETPEVETVETDEDTLVIPEDLTTLSAEELAELDTQARAAFDALAANVTPDVIPAMETLTEGIEALAAETARRDAEVADAAETVAALAARIAPVEDTETVPEDGESEEEPEAEPEVAEAPEAIAAAAAPRREVRVNLSSLRGRQTVPHPASTASAPRVMADIVNAAPNLEGFSEGAGMDWSNIGQAIDRQLRNFPLARYQQAQANGVELRQQFGLVTINKPFAPDLVINSDDPDHVDTVLTRAADLSRVGGIEGLVAAGWCAPSETVYDLCAMESRDGLYDLPEVNARRGGLRSSLGPSFSDLFNDIGFSYTEAEAIANDWDGQGGGAKPCYTVECPDFTDVRLRLDGLCLSAGLLQRRGYPEAIARTTQGALVGHDHRIAGGKLAAVASQSTAIVMPTGQVGATAPILTAVELQGEHYRESRRLSRSLVLEAVFPYWVRGAIRADLSRRLGVDLLDVSDARIDGWFRQRMIAPQFVYNWQGLAASTPASGMTAYPETVDFLLYAAGTWVALGSDVITLDTIYDSVNLGQNNYTALFSEEGWNVVQRCEDSRKITVPICASGATHIGVEIDCDGTEAA